VKVKIGEKTYCSDKIPIMIVVDEDEKKAIGNMPGEKFLSYPEEMTLGPEEVAKIMEIDLDQDLYWHL